VIGDEDNKRTTALRLRYTCSKYNPEQIQPSVFQPCQQSSAHGSKVLEIKSYGGGASVEGSVLSVPRVPNSYVPGRLPII